MSVSTALPQNHPVYRGYRKKRVSAVRTSVPIRAVGTLLLGISLVVGVILGRPAVSRSADVLAASAAESQDASGTAPVKSRETPPKEPTGSARFVDGRDGTVTGFPNRVDVGEEV